MNIYDSFPSKYLKPIDLGAKQPTVVIRTVEAQLLRPGGGTLHHGGGELLVRPNPIYSHSAN